MKNTHSKVLLVGCGAMGGALAAGWGRLGGAEIKIIDPHVVGKNCYASLEKIPELFVPDFIVFAIKPQYLDQQLEFYRRFITGKTIFISIAAGKSVASLKSGLSSQALVVRAMPNLPVTVAAGMTGLYCGDKLSPSQREQISQLFNCVGNSVWVDQEKHIDLITACSGSGPAYFYRFVEALTQAGQSLGLDPNLSQLLAEQTFVGAALLFNQGQDSASTWRQRVTSPGGTTEAALKMFDNEANLDKLMAKVVRAAYDRAGELSQ